jgi:hypothetical protein
METISNQAIGGARNVTFTAGDHRGARQEGSSRLASDRQLQAARDFQPYPAEVFDAKLS